MLTIISGTNRPGSNTRKIARHVERIYQTAGEPLQMVDLAEMPPEIFHPSSYQEKPAAFAPFIDKVLRARGLVIVTPEYNGGFPGVLKYFIDMLPFPESLRHRRVCFIGLAAGDWGALRPIEQLQSIFVYREAFVFPQRVFIRNCRNVINEAGELTSEDIDKRLVDQAMGFIKFADALRDLAQ